jgi:hypothetical protein
VREGATRTTSRISEGDLQMDDTTPDFGRIGITLELRVVPPDPAFVAYVAQLLEIRLSEKLFYLYGRLPFDSLADLFKGFP